jgi:hypothetical protein
MSSRRSDSELSLTILLTVECTTAAVTSKVMKQNDGSQIRTKAKLTKIIPQKQLHCDIRVVTMIHGHLRENPSWVNVLLQKPPFAFSGVLYCLLKSMNRSVL